MRKWVGLSVMLWASFAGADTSLWTEGKENPGERVNVGIAALTPDAFTRVAEKVDAAVVNISTTKVMKDRGFFFSPFGDRSRRNHPFGDDFFERFFGMPEERPREERRQSSLGSGFVLNPDGYIFTNNHVVEQADEIRVIFSDEAELPARVVGRDPKTDVALLKVESPNPLRSVILGDSSSLKKGEVVIAIGNPFGLSHTVTQGIVSAKERSIGHGAYDEFIQTDASINPGNSGGPLLNLYGEVVGINTAIVASGQGIGFAIPINLAKNILLKIKKDGKVVRGWLGVLIQKVTPETAAALKLPSQNGALVSEVTKGSPAQKAGIQAGDVIVRFQKREIKGWQELPIEVANATVGGKATVEVIREGERKTFQVEIEKLKDLEGEDVEGEGSAARDALGLHVGELTPQGAKSKGIDPDLKGVLVLEADPEGAAATKGVRPGDVILEVNRKRVAGLEEYARAVAKLKKGSTVLLLLRRGAITQFIAFTL